MKTAAQSSISEPSNHNNGIGYRKNSIMLKLIIFLIIIVGLSILYYSDYKGIQSQGILKFLQNISTTTKARKNSKVATKISTKEKKHVKGTESY